MSPNGSTSQSTWEHDTSVPARSTVMRRPLWLCILLPVVCTLLLAQSAPTQVLVSAFPHLTFFTPIFITAAPDSSSRIYVVQQDGVIKVFDNDSASTAASTFFDCSHEISSGSGEEGLLGLAFDPHFTVNGYFYVNYTTPHPLRTRIARFTVVPGHPDSADNSSEFVILDINQPYNNHKGGMLAFGPDGYLYVAVGDGGGSGDPENNAQNPEILLGKILRIDVHDTTTTTHYRIPPDNPFKSNGEEFRQEIWATGLRNPWRFSFDPATGTLWAGDVGQSAREEVDIIEKGKNYGWNRMEGFASYPPGSELKDTTGFTLPIKDYTHEVGNSIIGGYVYSGTARPDLSGAYIYGDYGSGRVWMLRYQKGRVLADSLLTQIPEYISSFGTDRTNELYIVTISSKSRTGIYKFAPRTLTGFEESPLSETLHHYELYQNYPNPFNPSTTIRYALPRQSHVTLTLFTMLGQRVAQLVSGEVDAGNHEVQFNASAMSSGMYFYRLQVGTVVLTRQLCFIR